MPSPHPERRLALDDLLQQLIADQRIAVSDRQRFPSGTDDGSHPLERIAAQRLNDLHCPGQVLDLDSLGEWLAVQAGQPYLRIDPLELDLAGVAGLMSAAFARRHGILAIAQDADSVTVASAQPYLSDWEADLGLVLKRRIRRVLASPLQIRQLGQEYSRLARSVSSASRSDSPGEAPASLEQLLDLGNGAAQA